MRTVIAMTGASGAQFGVEFLKKCPGQKFLVASKWGKSVLHQETGLTMGDLNPWAEKVFSSEDMNSPLASGSNAFDQLVILPCSMTTLGRVANGIGENLITRMAEVALKEKRKMILCLRETPLSAVALENALKLSKLGVTIMPISPAFYLNPQNTKEMAEHFSDHLLQMLGIPSAQGWRSQELPV